MSKFGFPSHEEVLRLRQTYPQGTRLELISMDDPYATLKVGDRATVTGMDDAGHIMCKWDAGSGLSLIPGVDNFRILTTAELLKEQTRAVAMTGRTNMLSTRDVFDIAMELGFDELCDFIFMDTKTYSGLIISGELPDDYEIPKL